MKKLETTHLSRKKKNPDPIEAEIRMARLKAGLTPWPDDDKEIDDD